MVLEDYSLIRVHADGSYERIGANVSSDNDELIFGPGGTIGLLLNKRVILSSLKHSGILLRIKKRIENDDKKEEGENKDAESTTLYIDPFRISSFIEELPKADYILLTHEHFDHTSIDDLKLLVKEESVIIAAEECAEKLSLFNNKKIFLKPGDNLVLSQEENNTIEDSSRITVRAIPAYNTNKFRDPVNKIVFHPKSDNKLGYLITINNLSILHPGDTDLIPEFKELEGVVDIFLAPVSGTYVMTPEEAVDAAMIIKPSLAIPIHYGVIVGSTNDAKQFKKLLSEQSSNSLKSIILY